MLNYPIELNGIDLSLEPSFFFSPDWYTLSENWHRFQCPSSSLRSVSSVNPSASQVFGQIFEGIWMKVYLLLFCEGHSLWCTRFLPVLEKKFVPYSLCLQTLEETKLLFHSLGLFFCLCIEKGIIALALCPVLLLYFFDLIVQRVSEKPQEPCLCMFKLLMLLK